MNSRKTGRCHPGTATHLTQKMAPTGGIEPPTQGLTVLRSTAELHRKKSIPQEEEARTPNNPGIRGHGLPHREGMCVRIPFRAPTRFFGLFGRKRLTRSYISRLRFPGAAGCLFFLKY